MANLEIKVRAIEAFDEVKGMKDVVKTIYFSVNGINSRVQFKLEDIERKKSKDLTPYDKLTESEIIGWIEQSVDFRAIAQQALKPKVRNMKLPWLPETPKESYKDRAELIEKNKPKK